MEHLPTLVAPSILACDFANLGSEVRMVDAAGADWIHCDVMDGHFVGNISFGPAVVQAVSRHTSLPLDVHLMISRPEDYYPRFVSVAHAISIHVEIGTVVAKTLADIRSAGCKAGLAISPATPIEAVEPYLGSFDILLVMTVVPGFGGQPFLPEMMEKVQTAAAWREKGGYKFSIEVDGGITVATAHESLVAGANILVAGTSVFKAEDPASEIQKLRSAR